MKLSDVDSETVRGAVCEKGFRLFDKSIYKPVRVSIRAKVCNIVRDSCTTSIRLSTIIVNKSLTDLIKENS
jgi:hypothetical protein